MPEKKADPKPPSFEEGLQQLEAIVKEMESGELPLERALDLFERGTKLSETCRKQLEEAETRVEILTRRAGEMQPQPFEDQMNLGDYIAIQQERVDDALEKWVPQESQNPSIMHKAMRYSLFAGGKRVRPLLAIAAADAVSDETEGVENAACSLELIHTYSLIHDDLPDLDNDDLRRGRPTCHKVFGNAMAILAGDSLLTLAFEVLAKLSIVDAQTRIQLVDELATASGTVGGMIGGQVNDIQGEGQPPTAELLDSIHRAKTGALLRASVRMGAIYAGAGEAKLAALTSFGEHVGLAFQIVDDLLDVEQSSETLGKTAGKDAQQQKITFPAVYGLDKSRSMAEEERTAAHAALDIFGDRADRLKQLADLIVQRKA